MWVAINIMDSDVKGSDAQILAIYQQIIQIMAPDNEVEFACRVILRCSSVAGYCDLLEIMCPTTRKIPPFGSMANRPIQIKLQPKDGLLHFKQASPQLLRAYVYGLCHPTASQSYGTYEDYRGKLENFPIWSTYPSSLRAATDVLHQIDYLCDTDVLEQLLPSGSNVQQSYTKDVYLVNVNETNAACQDWLDAIEGNTKYTVNILPNLVRHIPNNDCNSITISTNIGDRGRSYHDWQRVHTQQHLYHTLPPRRTGYDRADRSTTMMTPRSQRYRSRYGGGEKIPDAPRKTQRVRSLQTLLTTLEDEKWQTIGSDIVGKLQWDTPNTSSSDIT